MKLQKVARFLGPVVFLASLGGCTNASGERVTLWDWMHGREKGESQTKAKRSPGEDSAKAKAEGGSDRTSDASARTSTESGGERAADRSGPRNARDDGTYDGPDEGSAVASPAAVHSDALIINGETISVTDILEPLLPSIEKMARELPPRTYEMKLHDLVRRQIIEAVAQQLIWRQAKSKIDKDTEPQIDKAIDKMEKERINREFGGSEAKYERYLTRQGRTRADTRDRLRRTVIIDSYLREHLLPLVQSPRKRELQQYYESHLADFSKPSRREMFLIEVPIASFIDRRRPVTDTDLSEATKQARKSIEDAAAALQAGEPFEAVARKYSLGVNKEAGGAWGFIESPLQGRWAAPSGRLFRLQADEVSEIIESEKCFFIVKAGQVETGGAISFQEAQPQIVEAMRQERFMKLRADFLQKELEQSTIGSLDAFVTEVLKGIQRHLQDNTPPEGWHTGAGAAAE